MIVRRADPTDAPAIARVLRAAFAVFEPQYTAAAFAATCPDAATVAARIGPSAVWVAVADGVVVGTVTATPDTGGAYVRSMAVDPRARGRGVGRALLVAVEAWAGARGIGRLHLSTTPFLHDAIRLYERAGFVRLPGAGDLHGTPLFAMEKRLSEDDGSATGAPRDDGPRDEP